MSNSVDQVIAKIAFAFNRIFNDFKGIYLFGVHTDGKLHEDEDIELAAIFDIEDKSKREQIWPIIGKIETEMDVCIDLYPYTEESFKKTKKFITRLWKKEFSITTKGNVPLHPAIRV